MEMLDVVNNKDEVIGQIPHDAIYTKSFNRRIVHILVFNNKGEIALQLRSKEKRYLPHHWITSAGGHVKAGESYKEAAAREMQEEIGLSNELQYLYKDDYFDHEKNHIRFLTTYELRHNGPFEINPKEVEKMEFFFLAEIQKMVDRQEKFHPELLFLLKKHFNIK